jgi:putative ABC transport system substrate-binding protein
VSSDLAAKRLQLLKEAAPAVSRVAVLWNPDHFDPEYRETQAAGRVLGVEVQSLEVRRPADFDAAFSAAAAEGAQALVVVSSRLMTFSWRRVIEFAARQRIPVVSGWGPWAEEGALMSYGPDLDAIVRRAATHADRVLKGASPAQVPIELPTTHELVLNLRTARSLELSVPPSLRAQANRIIE